ncbi:MAG: hypothetical protein IIB62_07365 [Proteobacteria bacterium]|nr:hypothetical protein [Pseudomonadota bacterium]
MTGASKNIAWLLRTLNFTWILFVLVAALPSIAHAGHTLTASAGTPQSTAISTVFSTVLEVTYTDGGNPVEGKVVTFAVPGSGASATLSASSATTNAAGVASVTATANATVGAYVVTASEENVTDVTLRPDQHRWCCGQP